MKETDASDSLAECILIAQGLQCCPRIYGLGKQRAGESSAET